MPSAPATRPSPLKLTSWALIGVAVVLATQLRGSRDPRLLQHLLLATLLASVLNLAPRLLSLSRNPENNLATKVLAWLGWATTLAVLGGVLLAQLRGDNPQRVNDAPLLLLPAAALNLTPQLFSLSRNPDNGLATKVMAWLGWAAALAVPVAPLVFAS